MKSGVTVQVRRTAGGWYQWRIMDFGYQIGNRQGMEKTKESAKKAGYIAAIEYTDKMMEQRRLSAEKRGKVRVKPFWWKQDLPKEKPAGSPQTCRHPSNPTNLTTNSCLESHLNAKP